MKRARETSLMGGLELRPPCEGPFEVVKQAFVACVSREGTRARY